MVNRTIEAVYEKGVFRPLQKVELREGEKVRLRVEKDILEFARRYAGVGKYRGKLTDRKLHSIEVDLLE